jgi:flagellar protein FliO/FliZ
MPPARRLRAEPIHEEPASLAPSHSEPPPRPQREALAALADDLAAHPTPPVTPASPRPRAPTNSRPPTSAEAAAAADQSLAEMAQRLEAALRKPKAEAATAAVRPAPAPEQIAEAEGEAETATPPPPPPAPPRPARMTDVKPARTDGRAKEGKLYDTLEQEMASLLGRPPGKTG